MSRTVRTLIAVLVALATAGVAFGQNGFPDRQWDEWNRTSVKTVTLEPFNVSINVGEMRTFRMPYPAKLHKVFIQAEARGYDAAAEVWVNGDKKADLYVPRTDPNYTVTVGAVETNAVQIVAVPVPGYQGTLIIRAIHAVITDIGPAPGGPAGCVGCDQLPFTTYNRTVIGNVSSRAIYLVDQLESYTNYSQYGTYLLPIKKAAAASLAKAEAYGDASINTRPSSQHLLETLDWSEPYLDDMFERDRAFELARQLLSLREYIRRVLY